MKILAIILSLLSAPLFSFAAPEKYNTCKTRININSPINSSGYYFEEGQDCKHVYVLPPIKGHTKVSEPYLSITPEKCSIFDNFFQNFMAEAKHLKESLDQIRDDSYGRHLNQQVIKKSKECASLKASNREQQKLASEARAGLEAIKMDVADLETEVSECKKNCFIPRMKLRDLKQRESDLRKAVRLIESQMTGDTSELSLCEQEVTEIKSQLASHYQMNESQKSDYESGLDKVVLQVEKLENQFGGKHGASANVEFYIGHQKLVKEFQALNKDSGITFEKVLVQANIMASMNLSGNPSELNGILDYTMPYTSHESFFKSKNLEQVIGGLNDRPAMPAFGENQSLVGESFSSNIKFNQIAGCMLYKASNGSTNVTPESFANAISMNVVYKYGLKVNRKYRAKYNYAHIMKKIKEDSTEKGFFRSKSISKIVEEDHQNELINIEIDQNDTRFEYHDRMIFDIKTEIINRALVYVVKKVMPSALKMIQPPSRGIDDTAKTLKEDCQHPYCQVAGIALDIIGSFGGGTTAVSKFMSTQTVDIDEYVSENKMLPFYGSLLFSTEP